MVSQILLIDIIYPWKKIFNIEYLPQVKIREHIQIFIAKLVSFCVTYTKCVMSHYEDVNLFQHQLP